jgi:hypothetical protein
VTSAKIRQLDQTLDAIAKAVDSTPDGNCYQCGAELPPSGPSPWYCDWDCAYEWQHAANGGIEPLKDRVEVAFERAMEHASLPLCECGCIAEYADMRARAGEASGMFDVDPDLDPQQRTRLIAAYRRSAYRALRSCVQQRQEDQAAQQEYERHRLIRDPSALVEVLTSSGVDETTLRELLNPPRRTTLLIENGTTVTVTVQNNQNVIRDTGGWCAPPA